MKLPLCRCGISLAIKQPPSGTGCCNSNSSADCRDSLLLYLSPSQDVPPTQHFPAQPPQQPISFFFFSPLCRRRLALRLMKTAILLGEIGSLLLFLFSAPFSFIVCDAVSVPAAIPVPFTVCCRRCFSWCGKTARFAFTYWLLLPFTGALFLPLLSQLVFFLFGCRSTFFFVFGWQPTPKAFIGWKVAEKGGEICLPRISIQFTLYQWTIRSLNKYANRS